MEALWRYQEWEGGRGRSVRRVESGSDGLPGRERERDERERERGRESGGRGDLLGGYF